MGRTKKVIDAPIINSLLTLQLALQAEFAKRKLPQLTVTLISGAIYLTGPCGQQLCKILYIGSTKITISDYAVIFDHTVSFIDAHIKTLKRLFELRQTIKAAKVEDTKIPYDKKIFLGSDTSGKYVCFGVKHPYFYAPICRVYENSFIISGDCIKDKEFAKIVSELPDKLAKQRECLKEDNALKNMEEEVNQIIADLSACSI